MAAISETLVAEPRDNTTLMRLVPDVAAAAMPASGSVQNTSRNPDLRKALEWARRHFPRMPPMGLGLGG